MNIIKYNPLFKIDYNPVSKRWHERVDCLPQKRQDLINAPLISKENLLVLKKSKNPVKEGDVFVVSPKEGVYFFGKVLEADIQHIGGDPWITGSYVICIFRQKSVSKDIKDFKPDYSNLLISPLILTVDYWKRGWIETIGNIPLSEEEKKLDYGFYEKDYIGSEGSLYKANGEGLKKIPKYFGSYGISTLNGLYSKIKTELIIDPSLLE